jgi:hypothetical protein
MNRHDIGPVGVFNVMSGPDSPSMYVLLPHKTIGSFATAIDRLRADPDYQKAGAEFINASPSDPSYVRVESSLMVAFENMPKLEAPAGVAEKKPRIFELRTYESHSEAKALKKVEMFNSGEIEVMREVGLAPVFYGQAVIGRDLPHLTFMLSAEDRDAHKKHWGTFGGHSTWKKMKDDPQYANTVSKITSRFLSPASYSQI